MNLQPKAKRYQCSGSHKNNQITNYRIMKHMKHSLLKQFEGKNFTLYSKIKSQSLSSSINKKDHSRKSLTFELKQSRHRKYKSEQSDEILFTKQNIIQQLPQTIRSRKFTKNNNGSHQSKSHEKNNSFEFKTVNQSFRIQSKQKGLIKPILTITQVSQKSTPKNKWHQINQKRKQINNRFTLSRQKFVDKRFHLNSEKLKNSYRPWSGKNQSCFVEATHCIDQLLLSFQ